MTVDAVVDQLRDLPYQDIGFAKLDHHRALRTGWPEVVFGKGKSPKQVATIVKAFKDRGHPVLVTKTNQEAYLAVLKDTPEAEFHQLPAAIVVPTPNTTVRHAGIIIVTAGTADLPRRQCHSDAQAARSRRCNRLDRDQAGSGSLAPGLQKTTPSHTA